MSPLMMNPASQCCASINPHHQLYYSHYSEASASCSQSGYLNIHTVLAAPSPTHCTRYIPKASSHKYAGRYPFLVRRQTDQPEHHHRQSNEAIRSQAATIKLCRAVNPDSHKIASSSSRPLPSLHCRFIPSHKILQWPTGRGVQQTSYRQPE